MTSAKNICELEFSIAGMLRFVSHLELQNFFSRLIVRAGVGVKFSQGFNPRPRISLPVPRNVGIGSNRDRLRMEVDDPFDAEEMLERLRPIVPQEMELHGAWVVPADRLERVTAVEWQIDLSKYRLEPITQRVSEILGGRCPMTRHSKKQNRDLTVDLRPLILAMNLEGELLRVKVAYTPEGSVRPGELLELLHLPKAEMMGKMTRMRTYWE